MTQNSNTVSVLAPVAATAAAELALAEAVAEATRANAALQRQIAKEDAWAAKNAQFVRGSGHAPTSDDVASFEPGARVDATVYTITCADCGQERAVNPSDVFHVRRCRECTKTARKAAGKVKNAQKKVAKLKGAAPDMAAALEALKAKNAELKAKLGG